MKKYNSSDVYYSPKSSKKRFFVFPLLVILTFSTYSSAQTVEERQEFYKNMMAKGETLIKAFNNSKRNVHDKVFTDEYDGYTKRTEFQCVYELFLVNYFKNLDVLTSEFDKMNRFNSVPEMGYLKQMNSVQERKLSLLNEGIKFYDELSSEINSKPFKRWDAMVIDNFVDHSAFNADFEMYKLLRPVSYELFLLIKIQENASYLKCSYNYWDFMLKYEFEDISLLNPSNNFNMINHYVGFPNGANTNIESINNTNFDYSKVIFTDYSDYSIFSSWMDSLIVQDVNKNEKGLYSNEMANSTNALSLAFLIKSLDFQNSTLSSLFNKCNMPIKECTYDNYKVEFNYYPYEFADALMAVNNDSISSFIKDKKEDIHLLYAMVPDKTPWFYPEGSAITYKKQLKKIDEDWFNVFELKQKLITSSCYFNSILNDLELNDINSKSFIEWYNSNMNANQLMAYYRNEYMTKLGKDNPAIWTVDNQYLESVLIKMRLIKNMLKDDFNGFVSSYQYISSIGELDKLLNTNRNQHTKIDDTYIVAKNKDEVYYRSIYINYQSGNKTSEELNSLGWRCLLNNHLVNAEKYLLEGLKISAQNPMITINLAHVKLLQGDFKKAKDLYTKFPLNQLIPELEMDVITSIKLDMEEFVKNGVDPIKFEEIKKVLSL